MPEIRRGGYLNGPEEQFAGQDVELVKVEDTEALTRSGSQQVSIPELQKHSLSELMSHIEALSRNFDKIVRNSKDLTETVYDTRTGFRSLFISLKDMQEAVDKSSDSVKQSILDQEKSSKQLAVSQGNLVRTVEASPVEVSPAGAVSSAVPVSLAGLVLKSQYDLFTNPTATIFGRFLSGIQNRAGSASVPRNVNETDPTKRAEGTLGTTNKILGPLVKVTNGVMGLFGSMFANMGKFFSGFLKPQNLNSLLDVFKNLIIFAFLFSHGLGKFLSQDLPGIIKTKIIPFLGQAVFAILGLFKIVETWIQTNLPGMIKASIPVILNVIHGIFHFLSSNLPLVLAAVGGAMLLTFVRTVLIPNLLKFAVTFLRMITPIGLITAAIGGAIYALSKYQNDPKFKKGVDDFIAKLVGMVQGFAAMIGPKIVEFASKAGTFISNFLSSVDWGGLVNTVIQAISSFNFVGAFGRLGAIVGNIFSNKIIPVVNKFFEGMPSVLSAAGAQIGKLFVALLPKYLNALIVFWTHVPGILKGIFDFALSVLKTGALSLMSFSLGFLRSVFNSLLIWVNQYIVLPIRIKLAEIGYSIKSTFDDIMAPIVVIVREITSWVMEKIVTPLDNLFKNIGAGFNELITDPKKFFQEKVVNPVLGIFDSIKAGFAEFTKNPAKFIGDLFNSIGQSIKDAFSSIFEALSGSILGILSFIPGFDALKKKIEAEKKVRQDFDKKELDEAKAKIQNEAAETIKNLKNSNKILTDKVSALQSKVSSSSGKTIVQATEATVETSEFGGDVTVKKAPVLRMDFDFMEKFMKGFKPEFNINNQSAPFPMVNPTR